MIVTEVQQGSTSNALTLHSSAVHPTDYGATNVGKSQLTEKKNDASAKVERVFYIFKSFTVAVAFGGAATAWEFPPHTIHFFTVLGFCIFPIVERLKNAIDKSKIIFSILQKKKEMSKEQALALLNVPMERASDSNFIVAQYVKLIKEATPRTNLGQSPLAVGVYKLLEDIKQAYAIATTN